MPIPPSAPAIASTVRRSAWSAIAALGLAALLATWTVGCRSDDAASATPATPTSLEQLTAEIRRIVPASERQRRLVAIVEEIGLLEQQFQTASAELRHRWQAANADYATSDAEFEQLISDGREQRRRYLSEVVALRVEAASLLSVEEWRRLASSRDAARDSILGL